MTNMKKTTILIAFVLLIVTASAASAAPWNHNEEISYLYRIKSTSFPSSTVHPGLPNGLVFDGCALHVSSASSGSWCFQNLLAPLSLFLASIFISTPPARYAL